ncbi:MAG: hypothetical protein QOI64_678, partial [Solirubrobacteraceae bacterium]|nr:hypothetical protein [Solirubrobacteraceae bacterium]
TARHSAPNAARAHASALTARARASMPERDGRAGRAAVSIGSEGIEPVTAAAPDGTVTAPR